MKKALPFLFLPLLLFSSLAAAKTASNKPLKPSSEGPLIGQVVARILEQDHYEHKPLDAAVSRDMLKLYLDDYDPDKMFFDKSDVEAFRERYGDDMAQLVKQGDIGPAYFIFNRFMERVRQRVRFVHETLRVPEAASAPKTVPGEASKKTVLSAMNAVLASSAAASAASINPDTIFDFKKDESIILDREKLPWPADERAARELWRKRLKDDVLEEMLDKVKPTDQIKDVVQRYDHLLTYYKEFAPSDVLQAYLTALASTYDPHSDYMAASEEANFDISMRLSLVGIGAVLSQDGGYAKIVSLVPGGPADKSKQIHPNDRIVGVAQGDGPFTDVVGMRLDDVVGMIRGKKGTVVRLRLIPADALDPATRVVVNITREVIKLKDQEARAQVIAWPLEDGKTERLGVVYLPSFYADMRQDGRTSASRDVARLVAYLEKQDIAGLILDLRNDGGGSLAEAVAMAGLFDGPGPVVQVRDSRGRVEVLRAPESRPEYTGPMVVLTTRASASASEIVTAALQDYRRAVVVGEKSTFGKGTVQSVVDLGDYLPWSLHQENPGALKITIQKFYRVSGGSTQNRGVTPDIQLPSLDDELDMTESSLPNALPYDQIAPAVYEPANDVDAQEIAALRKASEERVAVSTDFAYVRQDIALYMKHKQDKSVSLNYAARLAQEKIDQEREEARKKERASRPSVPITITDVTLEDVIAGVNPLVSTSTAKSGGSQAAAGEPEPAASVSAPLPTPAQKAKGFSVASSSVSAAGYAHAPPQTDFVLEEAAHILADLVGKPSAKSLGVSADIAGLKPR
ncbi:MAG TPA: carboxy terminal-processing peptidase [Elusimicrobiota bacterium]|nr:carboxy terminal-processing peptidase [Elusimicrobiota bacterium]